MGQQIVAVAVPLKLNRLFDYLLPPKLPLPKVGCRVVVPIGKQTQVGWVTELKTTSEHADKLKNIDRLIDSEPLLTKELWTLLNWTANYYHHPLGQVIATALPGLLSKDQQPTIEYPRGWNLTTTGLAIKPETLARAPQQAAAIAALRDGPKSKAQLLEVVKPGVLRAVQKKGWIEAVSIPRPTPEAASKGPSLSNDQQAATDAIKQSLGGFRAHLLDGVTGSGKTEVYLHVIERVVASGQQALVIIPEIALTPQLLERFRQRLGCEVSALHSGLSDHQRGQVWLRARSGDLPVVIGTRSAVFCPLAEPGIIVVDEEHDLSLKQHDGLRYSARDLAVQRAQQNNIPVVLGSATPSLETLNNALTERYQHLILAQRPGAAHEVAFRTIDLRAQQTEDGLSRPVLAKLEEHLERGEQALVFLNRRGFAPVLICNACGWTAQCPRCDARMTWHRSDRRLRCHHCGKDQAVPNHCHDCSSTRLVPIGEGTQRLDDALSRQFKQYPILRLDRDATRSKKALPAIRAQLNSGQACVVIGTQMLAKGHDFPDVTLVCVANIDQALFSSDFRAAERAAQLLTQVAGRAGRAAKPGTVLIQTHHPDHPLFAQMLQIGYRDYALGLLRERRAAGFPPYGHMALLRAEAHEKELAHRFLSSATERLDDPKIDAFGPLPAPMERIAGRYRAQLLILSSNRNRLQQLLARWVPVLYEGSWSNRVRWSIDVDPQDTF